MGRPKKITKYIGENFNFIPINNDKKYCCYIKNNPKCSEENKLLVDKLEKEKHLSGDDEDG